MSSIIIYSHEIAFVRAKQMTEKRKKEKKKNENSNNARDLKNKTYLKCIYTNTNLGSAVGTVFFIFNVQSTIQIRGSKLLRKENENKKK